MTLSKIKEVALALGATLNNDAWRYTLTLGDLKFYASLSTKDKIKFYGSWPDVVFQNHTHTFRHQNHFDISVNVNRDAKSIARDVKNRFLNTYDGQYREMLAKSFEFLNDKQNQRAQILELFSIFQDFKNFEGQNKEEFYVDINDISLKISKKYRGYSFEIDGFDFETSRNFSQILRTILKQKEVKNEQSNFTL